VWSAATSVIDVSRNGGNIRTSLKEADMTSRQKARAIQLTGVALAVYGISIYQTSDTFGAWLLAGIVAVIGGKAWEYMQRE
jgi:hypothetical protein